MPATLNPKLALIVRTSNGDPDAICFIADGDQPLESQANDYLLHEDLDPETMVDCYWYESFDDKYGNTYKATVNQEGGSHE